MVRNIILQFLLLILGPLAYVLVVRFNFPFPQVVHVLGTPLVMPEVFSSQQRIPMIRRIVSLTHRPNLGRSLWGPKNKNQFRIRPRFRRNQALWAKNTDADGFGICSPLVFDRSAEQIGRKPICPNLIGTGSSLIYQISYLFLNRNQSRIGPRRRQNHKAWPEIWTRTGTDPGLVPVFVRTISPGRHFAAGVIRSRVLSLVCVRIWTRYQYRSGSMVLMCYSFPVSVLKFLSSL